MAAIANPTITPRFGFGTDKTTKDAVLVALKAGYRLIDTARVYVDSEVNVGNAIKESGLNRNEIYITTKIIPEKHDQVFETVEESLKALQTDYIDLLLLHGAHPKKERRLSMYKDLIALKEAGKIESFGVSNFNVAQLEEIRLEELPKPAVNQLEIHPLCQHRVIVPYCQDHSIVVQAYCPIMRGTAGEHAEIRALADKYDRDPSQIVLRWSHQKGFVPLPKSNTPARIISNSQIFGFELTPEDIGKLDALDRGKKGSFINPKHYPADTP